MNIQPTTILSKRVSTEGCIICNRMSKTETGVEFGSRNSSSEELFSLFQNNEALIMLIQSL